VQPRYSARAASRIPSPVETVADPLGALASTRRKASASPRVKPEEQSDRLHPRPIRGAQRRTWIGVVECPMMLEF
jgi:hypothetical protein